MAMIIAQRISLKEHCHGRGKASQNNEIHWEPTKFIFAIMIFMCTIIIFI